MKRSSLTDPYLKLNWAKHHLDALDSELTVFYKSKPCRFFEKADLKEQRYKLTIKLLDVPDELSLRCGDAFYCMRACLDQIVWRLAKLSVVIPDKRIAFPVVSQWDSNGEGIFKTKLADVPVEAMRVIRDLQPASGTAPKESHLLWRLDAMCNLDKHRRIPANGSHVQFNLPPGVSTLGIDFETFDDYGVLSVPLADKDKLNFHPHVSFQVNFGDVSAGVVVGPTEIAEIYNFISDSVLPRFVRFLT